MNPPSTSSSTSSNDANLMSINPDLKLENLDKVKVDVENKPPSLNNTSDKLNLQLDMTQENATPLTMGVDSADRTHIGPTSASSSTKTKLRK